MLKEKYAEVLQLGLDLGVKDGYVIEEDGKLKIGGTCEYQHDSDQIWDKLKTIDGWQDEVVVDTKVEKTDIYGYYTVKPGDTLWKLSSSYFGKGSRYMEIFEANKDILKNPDLIKVGQKLRLPHRS
jgi:LysM repeat protein